MLADKRYAATDGGAGHPSDATVTLRAKRLQSCCMHATLPSAGSTSDSPSPRAKSIFCNGGPLLLVTTMASSAS
jgi:hypothetical protein